MLKKIKEEIWLDYYIDLKDPIVNIVEQAYKAGKEDALKEYLPLTEECEIGKRKVCIVCRKRVINEIIDRAKKDGINLNK